MHLQESGEMYLESILRLSEKLSVVRSVDISEYMGYSKPSVSRAVGLLKNGGYITVGDDGAIKLTDDGRAVAGKIYERHRILTGFFKSIGVSPETASEDACKIEHSISDETLEKIKEAWDKYTLDEK
ncbi:MAG: metal-dependent transcriptional regulator [Ruminococcaceae bacterium]|nr:metal-dependent transcriptional regulator [Oscillospiraceae bacterium]